LCLTLFTQHYLHQHTEMISTWPKYWKI
jgi:hypothetical protein